MKIKSKRKIISTQMAKRYNSFVLFCKQHREHYKMIFPDKSNSEITTMLSSLWKSLDQNEKQYYIEKAADMRKVCSEISREISPKN